MTVRTGRIVIALVTALVVAACGGQQADPDLINIRRGQNTPDEFAILPTKPLEIPDSLATTLPPPTPGQANRVDPTPQADAVAALGGNPARIRAGGVPRSDGALLNHTTRYGVRPTIRQELAASDLEFRRKRQGRVLERVFNITTYYRAYRDQSLDKFTELERFRRAGIRTVGAPPKESATR
ncbi:DUF3035 domain-containing protein [Actibacterium sp. 188UL27-1]|uniref:DUF3035 domain-containing protein n=1 Tax=Actibacterium sp. 188UL27-1 TaxID=2786961 RepID=UPI00195B43AC|nr:DUF3035 domain-containing protein [Actibacterium sp. 188UL27-1]MBM7068507.1 DUF3035 domain-containing protein [Actibacterium sp. 188UL27-1]